MNEINPAALKEVLKEMFKTGEIQIQPVTYQESYSDSETTRIEVIIDGQIVQTLDERTEYGRY